MRDKPVGFPATALRIHKAGAYLMNWLNKLSFTAVSILCFLMATLMFVDAMKTTYVTWNWLGLLINTIIAMMGYYCLFPACRMVDE